uniref:Uncharacterized protein n=1 Tax=Palpitomonas bilix TaxID=652834 RepID=A0A7S3GGH0_9EUKA|mmetsp:Transcript_48040/g.124788  ORF Transcript_48040/g.124788 Transcript_48040/m.124788 type:complete len:216 (+) Transcript_48040:78-725(+)
MYTCPVQFRLSSCFAFACVSTTSYVHITHFDYLLTHTHTYTHIHVFTHTHTYTFTHIHTYTVTLSLHVYIYTPLLSAPLFSSTHDYPYHLSPSTYHTRSSTISYPPLIFLSSTSHPLLTFIVYPLKILPPPFYSVCYRYRYRYLPPSYLPFPLYSLCIRLYLAAFTHFFTTSPGTTKRQTKGKAINSPARRRRSTWVLWLCTNCEPGQPRGLKAL